MTKLGLDQHAELPLDDIWENQIMTNFEKHWDYFCHKPASQKDKNEKPARDSFELLKCFSNQRKPQVEYRLEDFWRFGIPYKYRKVLWPFAIQNKFGLSKQLYKIKLSEGLQSKLPVQV